MEKLEKLHTLKPQYLFCHKNPLYVISGWENIPNLVPIIKLSVPIFTDCRSSLSLSISSHWTTETLFGAMQPEPLYHHGEVNADTQALGDVIVS